MPRVRDRNAESSHSGIDRHGDQSNERRAMLAMRPKVGGGTCRRRCVAAVDTQSRSAPSGDDPCNPERITVPPLGHQIPFGVMKAGHRLSRSEGRQFDEPRPDSPGTGRSGIHNSSCSMLGMKEQEARPDPIFSLQPKKNLGSRLAVCLLILMAPCSEQVSKRQDLTPFFN